MRDCGGIQYSGFSNGVRYVLGWCCVFVTMLPDTIDDSSTSTRGLYLRSSQRCLIKRIRDFKEVSYLYYYKDCTDLYQREYGTLLRNGTFGLRI